MIGHTVYIRSRLSSIDKISDVSTLSNKVQYENNESFQFVKSNLLINNFIVKFKGPLIKTHDSESRGQEEVQQHDH